MSADQLPDGMPLLLRRQYERQHGSRRILGTIAISGTSRASIGLLPSLPSLCEAKLLLYSLQRAGHSIESTIGRVVLAAGVLKASIESREEREVRGIREISGGRSKFQCKR
jgi:hypothetical protein